jgi:GT2 family glycosyltransferase/uncharacterized coiled-coil protein SlyX
VDHDKATPQELRWRIAQLEIRLAEQERINKDIQSSTIWRATAPLRALLGPLSRLKRGLSDRTIEPSTKINAPFEATSRPLGPLQAQPWEPATSRHSCVIELVFEGDGQALALGHLLITSKAHPEKPLLVVDFSSKGNSSTYKVFGFEPAEKWGSWTKSRRAQVHLWLPDFEGNQIILELNGCYRENDNWSPSARVLVNGKDSGLIDFGRQTSARLDSEIDAQAANHTSASFAHNKSSNEAVKPIISVIILNYNKPYLTFLALKSLLAAKTAIDYEIIVLDNGSTPENAAILASMDLPVRLLRLEENRFFGEGNNIAAEVARGERLLFLNNDVFISDFTLDKLNECFASSSQIGASGPIFTYPDETLQEAGAFIAKDASVYQRGKGSLEFNFDQIPAQGEVDYISAACLMVDRRRFLEIGGFDLRYDPAYYEDSDLCLRLLGHGLPTILVRDCQVVHIENATTASAENKAITGDITERHRHIFLSRWGKWLADRAPENLPQLTNFPLADHEKGQRIGDHIDAAFTPYPLTQGGGERYLLAAAQSMGSKAYNRTSAIITPTRYSDCRLNTLCWELGLPNSELRSLALQQAASKRIHRYIHMGNELLPSTSGLGLSNVFHCQFPFPEPLAGADVKRGLDHLATYDVVVVNSHFTRTAYLRALAKVTDRQQDVRVIYPGSEFVPPVSAVSTKQKEKLILSIGRFCPKGHAKRQDLIVAAFKKLRSQNLLDGWRVVFCGNVLTDSASIDYFESLKAASMGLPIEFALSPDRARILSLYQRASIYVSATGAGIQNPRDYHRCEHFGITVVEALSAGCLPVVYKTGGPAEIVAATDTGFTFDDEADLRRQLMKAADQYGHVACKSDIEKLEQLYGQTTFMRHWEVLWREIG